ncbi:MAG: phenylalanine--tRNA ligase subunit beta [Gammaproteobacteria bacterium]|nr:phenylalanine--tRNA ligase subunit beta [Gammaproteobacteria bacterium]NNL10918.1 phenylalanine--tRNA ligase subunit beta [Pseudomonadales bacterium]
MKISEAWLREWVDPGMSTSELVHTLTMAGLEVDGVAPAAPEFSGVLVGQIEAVEPHPDAEKLRVCSVTDGLSNFQVVCGAPNAAVGMKIPFAKVGAELSARDAGAEALKIKKAKLRGVESFGMLCGASELGLEDVVDGLLELPADAPVGDDFRDYLNLDDAVIEVDLTPNRGDCLSVLGVAREVGVLARKPLTPPKLPTVPAKIDTTVAVSLHAADYCPRYAGRVICGIDNTVASPFWLREKLRRAGLRSIDPVVDITNYVMLELGQPMHAFDLDKIAGDIVVRTANAGEKIVLLDGSELALQEGFLLIADQQQPLALAGIMGGASSAVSAETKHILLESAYFAPEQHAGKARQVGMHTDSSHRFERGVDRAGQARALERATELLLSLCGGEPGPVNNVEHAQAALSGGKQVVLRESQITRILGFEIPAADVEDMFARLDFSPEKTADGWRISVPSHRFDIALEADLLEELARVYGYENVPVEPPLAPMHFSLKREAQLPSRVFRDRLVARGYREAVTYSFIDPEYHALFFPGLKAVELTNPIASDMAVMRTSLLPGLVKTASYNLSRQQRRLQLFEQGLRFMLKKDGEINQRASLAGLLCGERHAESWLSKPEAVKAPGQHPDRFDFYDVKGDVQAQLNQIAANSNDTIEYHALNDSDGYPCLHPGQSAAVCRGNRRVGVLGALHPKLLAALDIDMDIWLFELDIPLISDKKVPEFKELSKFPEVRRDLAIIVDQAIPVGDVLAAAKRAAAGELQALVVFDRYLGEGVGEGKQSIGLGLTWQHPARTLQDDEVATLTNKVVTALQEQFDAQLR